MHTAAHSDLILKVIHIIPEMNTYKYIYTACSAEVNKDNNREHVMRACDDCFVCVRRLVSAFMILYLLMLVLIPGVLSPDCRQYKTTVQPEEKNEVTKNRASESMTVGSTKPPYSLRRICLAGRGRLLEETTGVAEGGV